MRVKVTSFALTRNVFEFIPFSARVLRGLHSNNGVGRGTNDDVLIGRAAAGVPCSCARRDGTSVTPYESIELPNTVENPSYL
jgi:hypothetical protein